jgi:hypothetical protein
MSDTHRIGAVPSLHDCLALGQVEVGLATTQNPTGNSSSSSSSSSSSGSTEEVHRLPLLLRWLHQARPWTQVPELIGLDEKPDATAATGAPQDATRKEDAVLEEAVARMEDRAALYSVAEGVQLVACHLAPAACLRASRLPPLRRQRTNHQTEATDYDTTPLMALAQNALAAPKAMAPATTGNSTISPKKQRRSSLSGSGGGGGGPNSDAVATDRWETDPDELHGGRGGSDGSDLEDYGVADMKSNTTPHMEGGDDGPSLHTSAVANTNKKRSRKSTEKRAQSSQALFGQASPDSVEYLVLHTLQELIRLVADSLSPSNHSSATITKLSSDDLLLAEPARQAMGGDDASSVGGAMDAHDLGVTLVSLLHNAPVLAHEHVAVRVKTRTNLFLCG